MMAIHTQERTMRVHANQYVMDALIAQAGLSHLKFLDSMQMVASCAPSGVMLPATAGMASVPRPRKQ
jgi:hypothetical protein